MTSLVYEVRIFKEGLRLTPEVKGGYCTNSLNSAVTGHRVPLPAEMSQVSQPVRLGDETIL